MIKFTYWNTPPARFKFEGYKTKYFKHNFTFVIYMLFSGMWNDRWEIEEVNR